MPQDRSTPDVAQPDVRQEMLLAAFPPVSTEAWEARIREDLKGSDYEKRLVWKPFEGFAAQPYYRAEDVATLPGGRPAPLARAGATGNAWHILEAVAGVDASDANRRAHAALEGGATALTMTLRLDETGGGVPVRRQADLQRLLDGLPLADAPLHLEAGPGARLALAMLLNEAERQDLDAAALSGSVAFDPMALLARQGRLDVAGAYDEAARLLADVEESGASLRALDVDLRPYHEAGATAVQELALALATVCEHLAALTDRDADSAGLLPRLRFVVPVGGSFLLEIARLRALRQVAPRLYDAFAPGADPALHVEAVTSRATVTRYDPHVNTLRATTQAAAAVIGGCDALRVLPFDAANAPGDLGARIARNVHLILQHESHLDAVTDPAAGAYYVEVLTDRLAREAWALFQQIEARGGLFEALRQGFVQEKIAAARAAQHQDIAAARRALVGTNTFPDLGETRLDDAPPVAPPPAETSSQHAIDAPLAGLRARLQKGIDAAALLREAADDKIVIIEPLPAGRLAEPFEALRLRTERHARAAGRRPTVFALPIGDPVMANARATFARNFFGCAGFGVIENTRFATIEEGAQAARASDADLVVLCSADPEYAAFAPPLCRALHADEKRPLIVVAGYPADQVEALQAAGVDGFIHRKLNLLETLTRYQEQLGVAP